MDSTHLKQIWIKLEIFSNGRGEHKNKIWNHHLDRGDQKNIV